MLGKLVQGLKTIVVSDAGGTGVQNMSSMAVLCVAPSTKHIIY